MKLILQQEVKKLGNKGDIIDVSEGYARNFLLPKQLAVVATSTNVKSAVQKKAAAERKSQQLLDEEKVMAAQLTKVSVVVEAKMGTAGKLFGSITAQDVADALKQQYNIDLDKRKIKWVAISAISQPVLAGDEIYAIGSNHETTPGVNPLAIQARDAATGEIKWQWHFNDIDNWISYSHRYLVATDDVIFVPFDNATIALSRQTHEKVWTTPETGLLVVGDNKLFIVGYEKGKGIKVAGFALS